MWCEARNGVRKALAGNWAARILSGKTGTSNDRRDAWFGGFNAILRQLSGLAMTMTCHSVPREEGSRTALPIWIEFVRSALTKCAGTPDADAGRNCLCQNRSHDGLPGSLWSG